VTGGSFFHFRLCPIADSYSPALGWALSMAARKAIDGMLVRDGDATPDDQCLKDNRGEFDSLIKLLREN
jgi:hypothetical protein